MLDYLHYWLSKGTENTTSVVEFGSMFFEKLALVNPNVKNKIGIEAHKPYIDSSTYHNCMKIQGDMRNFESLVDNKYYDCALFIDSIEHLDMVDALDLIGKCKEKFNKIMIVVPEGVTPQSKDVTNSGADELQTHRSTWYPTDMEKLGFSFEILYHGAQPSMFAVWERKHKLKYSIVMPYYDRQDLELTLGSFMNQYKDRLDYEVTIVEATRNVKNPELHNKLLNIIDKFKKNIFIKHIEYIGVESYNPACLFNLGVKQSLGEIIILTSPECYHETNILQGLDKEFSFGKNIYVVCGCRAASFDGKYLTFDRWYQHSIHSNRMLHFCSAITKENFIALKGFDEEYSKGIAYEDDDFREKILKKSWLDVVLADDLLVTHINHDTTYQQKNHNLTKLNRNYYLKKWGKEPA